MIQATSLNSLKGEATIVDPSTLLSLPIRGQLHSLVRLSVVLPPTLRYPIRAAIE